MAEEYCGGANWWDSSPSVNRNRFDGGSGGGGSSTSSATTTLTNTGGVCGYGWLTEDHSKMDPSVIQLSGLGLTSGQGLDWNHQQQQQQQSLRSSEKGENNFHHGSTDTMFSSQYQWRDKFFENSSEFKQLGFSIDQHHELISPSCSSMESTVTCQALSTSPAFHLDSPSSSILQGFMGAHQHQQMSYHNNNNNNNNYIGLDNNNNTNNKVPQFSNNSTYLNVDIVRPNLMSSFQPQLPMPSFEEKPKLRNTTDTIKRGGGSENNTKRTRSETATSTLPPFKVRKEKMGDRITALQQLVSPFGKTDTASVLSEAIEYIKFLHEQVGVLSTPYLKNEAASYQQSHQGGEKETKDNVGQKQDLKSRGLCLVPVSSTFPMTHETTVDFWTPTFGGTFR